MMAYSPIILLAVLMVGYPLAQIAAIYLRRSKRLRFNALITELRGDPAYQGEGEQAALTGLMEESRGTAVIALAPIAVPIVAIAELLAPRSNEAQDLDHAREFRMAFRHLDRVPQDSQIWEDPRLLKAIDLTILLAFAVWPITIAVAMLLAAPFALAAFLVAWVRDRTIEALDIRAASMKLTRVLHVMAYH